MKTKITDYHSLQLKKQRLKLLCAAQEKEMAENFSELKSKLNPSTLMREAILEMVPRDIRENKIVAFITSLFKGNSDKNEVGGELLNLAKTTLFTAALKYLDKFLNKE